MKYKNISIEWLGHSGFLIKDKIVIAIDPYKIEVSEKADIILVTHPHYDHCNSEDLKKLEKEGTIIITVADCQSKLGTELSEVKLIEPHQKISIEGIEIEAVRAYNMNKNFHVLENDWVGFIITIDGVTIYHAGDTDATPDIENLKNIDIALLPISGTYVMTATEAARIANKIKPALAIPMHYGAGVAGTKKDAEVFKEKCKCQVEIL